MYFLNPPRICERKIYAEIWETDFEKTLNDVELRNWCFSQYFNPLRGKTFVNLKTRIPITVNKDLRGEMIQKVHISLKQNRNVARVKFLSLKALKKFLTDSDPYLLYEPSTKKQIEHCNIFKYYCKINGNEFCVYIRTRKPYNYADRLYFLNFSDIELDEV